MKYPEKLKTIIDVTKEPYCCDNTGVKDCTEALCRALDDILRPNIDGIDKALAKLNASEDPNYRISFEIRKVNGVPNVIFPEELEPAKILYFPSGTYLVSDTISHNLENLKNILSGNRVMEINRQIYILGESMEHTIIKLKDNCPGFGFGNKKPIISYIRTEKSNIAQTNSIADITIDCGSGNAGAIGLQFYSSNSGAVRNVKIISSDSGNRGYCGLLFDGHMEAFAKNVTVCGFDYGVKVADVNIAVSFEKVRLMNQNVTGFLVKDSNVSILDLTSLNKTNPFRTEGSRSMVVLLNAELTGGDSMQRAVIISSGEAYLRNVRTQGYRYPLIIGTTCNHFDPYIEEFSTAEKRYMLFENEGYSLGLPVEDTPEDCIFRENDIAFVDDYGAVGDGFTDATEAIQKAVNSGKKCILFGSGHYLVDGTITVPATVRIMDFMYCDFYAGENLIKSKNTGLFKINEDSKEHITLKNVFTWERFYGYFRFIEHACRRDVVMKDLHTQCAGMYFNSVEGSNVYIENCACTMGGGEYCAVEPFVFKGQKVWCKNINPERGDVQILNDHSALWILGMKTESWIERGATTAVKNINGAQTECFGAHSGIGGRGVPLYINDNSDLSVFMTSSGDSERRLWNILVRETRGSETRELRFEDAYQISWFACRVFGFIGKR